MMPTASAAASSLTPVDLKGLIWTLVRTDFKVRYHQTLMGFFWALLKPVTMLVAMLAVFSFIFAKDPNYKLNLVIALFLYDFFGEATRTGLISLHTKGFLLTKTRFPRWIVVVTSISNPLITLLVVSVAMVLILVVSGRAPDPLCLLLFLSYVVQFCLMVIGFSLGSSVLFLRYRDLNQVWDVLVSAGFFIAPVVYPVSILPERFHFYLYLWPPTAIVQFSRSVLVEGIIPSAKGHALLALMTAMIFGLGTLIFRQHQAKIAERI